MCRCWGVCCITYSTWEWSPPAVISKSSSSLMLLLLVLLILLCCNCRSSSSSNTASCCATTFGFRLENSFGNFFNLRAALLAMRKRRLVLLVGGTCWWSSGWLWHGTSCLLLGVLLRFPRFRRRCLHATARGAMCVKGLIMMESNTNIHIYNPYPLFKDGEKLPLLLEAKERDERLRCSPAHCGTPAHRAHLSPSKFGKFAEFLHQKWCRAASTFRHFCLVWKHFFRCWL